MSPSLPVRVACLASAAAAMTGAAVVATQARSSAGKMADAAAAFLAAVPPELRDRATFPFDDPHRLKWYFTPQQRNGRPTRKGVRLDQLDDRGRAAAITLLRTGLSATGFDQATAIMQLEALMAELEAGRGANTRDPGWYFVSIFGEPSATGRWGWRVEGHHLSVNFTLDGGRIVSGSPTLFGVNPAEIKHGPRKGSRVTPEVEDLAKALIASLSDDQRKAAAQMQPFPEIREGQPSAGVGDPVGLPAADLSADQKGTLNKLIAAYARRLPADVAEAELARVAEAGEDKVRFGYHIAADKPGKPYTYRVHGPTFVIEFLNEQADAAGNPANHIHSGWRRLPDDFAVGKD